MEMSRPRRRSKNYARNYRNYTTPTNPETETKKMKMTNGEAGGREKEIRVSGASGRRNRQPNSRPPHSQPLTVGTPREERLSRWRVARVEHLCTNNFGLMDAILVTNVDLDWVETSAPRSIHCV